MRKTGIERLLQVSSLGKLPQNHTIEKEGCITKEGRSFVTAHKMHEPNTVKEFMKRGVFQGRDPETPHGVSGRYFKTDIAHAAHAKLDVGLEILAITKKDKTAAYPIRVTTGIKQLDTMFLNMRLNREDAKKSREFAEGYLRIFNIARRSKLPRDYRTDFIKIAARGSKQSRLELFFEGREDDGIYIATTHGKIRKKPKRKTNGVHVVDAQYAVDVGIIEVGDVKAFVVYGISCFSHVIDDDPNDSGKQRSIATLFDIGLDGNEYKGEAFLYHDFSDAGITNFNIATDYDTLVEELQDSDGNAALLKPIDFEKTLQRYARVVALANEGKNDDLKSIKELSTDIGLLVYEEGKKKGRFLGLL